MKGHDDFAALERERQAIVAASRGKQGDPAVRDAATLIILDETAPVPRILMGRRGAGHVFMPNRHVFPGGRVEEADLELAPRCPLSEQQVRRLAGGWDSTFSQESAAALPLAAIRETFEETGLLFGIPSTASEPVPSEWRQFAKAGLWPAVEWLTPVARAITPEGAPRRFDARFFCVSASRLSAIPDEFTPPTDEFDGVDWVSVDQLDARSIAPITRRILDEVLARLEKGTWLEASQPMPFFRIVDGAFARDLI
ncbi:NUDIX hydrolase [Jiella marina]|uniref:NUDIX hydrolase n=1 Tax=Jiella sp. LLJ827 TaxID=2917712 RepID=UPI0021012517|nr:NUDIX hydrolase [Jiella sp. LLJ827]